MQSMRNHGGLQGTKMLYPLRFNPILVERVWGGQTLTRFGKVLPPGKQIGESWEISDRDEAQSVVANGPDKGKTLRQLIEANGHEAIVGRRPSGRGSATSEATSRARFPLLVKLLDARERLSLQVHPPAHIATKLKGEPKTEMWYILDADRDAHLIAGMRRGVPAPEFMRALEQSPQAVETCVHQIRVRPGDSFFVPSGRIHSIDAGITLVEIQQNSDTTYRIHDWGRVGMDGRPRRLHVSESLACIDFQDFEPKKIVARVESKAAGGLWHLVECEHFHVNKIVPQNAWPDRCDGLSFHVLACIEGTVGILTASGFEERLTIGQFVLLPAALGPYTLTPLAENTQVLKAWAPAR